MNVERGCRSKQVYLTKSHAKQVARSLLATALNDGRLRIHGQDLGPSVAVSGEGRTEYEWDEFELDFDNDGVGCE